VPSARLSYALALGNGYFSPEERLSLRTGAVRFTALAPPAAGRPRGWEGAVGSLRASARAAAPSVRAGDPVEFVVRLEGDANVGLLPRPAVAAPWADLVETGDRVEVDSTARTVRGAKEFTWLLTPRTAGAFATPAVRYPYFDPARRAYDELVVPPVALRVRPGGAGPDVVAGPAAARDTTLRLGIRTVWRGAVGPALPSRPGFWLLVALAPAPAALVLAGRAARRRRAARPADPARALRALAAGGPDDPRAVRRAVHAAFAARVGFDPTACAGPTAFARALRRVGVSDHTASDAAACVAALDAAAFDAARDAARDAAPGTAEPAAARALAARAQQVLRDVDAEAQSRAALGAPYAAPPHQRGPRATRAPLLFAAAAAAAGSAAAACAEQRPAAPAATREPPPRSPAERPRTSAATCPRRATPSSRRPRWPPPPPTPGRTRAPRRGRPPTPSRPRSDGSGPRASSRRPKTYASDSRSCPPPRTAGSPARCRCTPTGSGGPPPRWRSPRGRSRCAARRRGIAAHPARGRGRGARRSPRARPDSAWPRTPTPPDEPS
jgi:hypothetical protein